MLYASPIVSLQAGIGIAVCLVAVWKGDTAERIAGALVLANLLFTMASDLVFGSTPPLGRLIADGVTALGFLVLALWTAGPWIGAVMFFYAAQFALHSFYFVTDRGHDAFHAWVNNLIFSGIWVCLLAGAIVAMERRRRAKAASGSRYAAP